MTSYAHLLVYSIAALFASSQTRGDANDWSAFRGIGGKAGVESSTLPDQWSDANIAWKVPLAGPGISSPSIQGEKIIITLADDSGTRRIVQCHQLDDGSVLWTHEVPYDANPKHAKNSFATATAAWGVDDCYVLFGSATRYSLLALDNEGKERWTCELGSYVSRHGPGASPIVVGDRVIVTHEQDGESSVVGVEANTGKIAWRIPRDGKLAAYSTPMAISDDAGTQVVISSTAGIASLDPINGQVLWSESCFKDRVVGSPAHAGSILIASCGGGGKGTQLVALRTDRTLADGSTRKLWELNRTIPYCPSPIIVGELAFLILDNGVARCVRAASGEEVWTERLLGTTTSSPVYAGNRIFVISESGEIVVLAASEKFTVLARNKLDDSFLSTPALVGNRMIIRGEKNLWCLQP